MKGTIVTIPELQKDLENLRVFWLDCLHVPFSKDCQCDDCERQSHFEALRQRVNHDRRR